MNIALPIISSLVIIYVRIWIVNTIFSEKKIKLSLTLKVFGIWLLLVWGLFIYKYLLSYFGSNLYFLDKINTQNILLFIFYCTAVVLIITLFMKWWYKKIIQTILVWSLFFIAIGYGGYLLWLNFLLLFYIISAYSEEYLKYSAGTNLFSREKNANTRDLIFFCLLIWLWFAGVENIFYLVYNVINHNDVNIAGLVVGRGLISTLIHIVSTSLIAYITISISRKKSYIVALLVGIIWWWWLHSAYNLSLEYNLQYISIPLIILCFFLLTFLLYQSDIIYEKD